MIPIVYGQRYLRLYMVRLKHIPTHTMIKWRTYIIYKVSMYLCMMHPRQPHSQLKFQPIDLYPACSPPQLKQRRVRARKRNIRYDIKNSLTPISRAGDETRRYRNYENSPYISLLQSTTTKRKEGRELSHTYKYGDNATINHYYFAVLFHYKEKQKRKKETNKQTNTETT